MSDMVEELRILQCDSDYSGSQYIKENIFDTNKEYVIPLYQRAFAWEDLQITQMLEDINDIEDNAYYYLGSLIVSEHENQYEVVDGQQRLTTLFLLLNCLEINVNKTLSFACREKSNYTLNNIHRIINDERDKYEIDRLENGITRGIRIIKEYIEKPGFDKSQFKRNLSNVIIYRIKVPEHTDLNRYFEIMNTRGEQLEQHDILKAELMSYLEVGDKNGNVEQEKALFAKIWNACSDMTGYVQMHFRTNDNVINREKVFGDWWDGMPSHKWEDYLTTDKDDHGEIKINDNEDETTINSIINNHDLVKAEDFGYTDDDTRVRFESIIEFPFFLLHTLKVFVEINGISHKDGKSSVIQELLDDKKLLDSFKGIVDNGVFQDGQAIHNEKARFAREFVVCLIRTRYLFDKFIIKREFVNDSSDGNWSLKRLKTSNGKPFYVETELPNKGEWHQKDKNPSRVKENIMIQSALRVSYTSPRVMHWITILLMWLSNGNNTQYLADYCDVSEKIARKAVNDNFFRSCSDGLYEMGVDTPHIVFNYLDYLLWKNNKEDYKDFVFEFRNSVEHWYPRNPSEGTFEQWNDDGGYGKVDRFGNLCLVQRNINSRFSNMSPEAKKSTFEDMIRKGSLKLRIMSEKTKKQDDKPDTSASKCWKEELCEEHELDMITLLKDHIDVQP